MATRTVLLGFTLIAALPAFAADDLNARVAGCRKLPDAAARLSCYDRAVDDQLAPAPKPPTPAVQAAPAPAPAAASAPQAAPAPPAARFGAENIIKPEPDPGDIDSITAVVTAVSVNPYGGATASLDNGQVWRQIENVKIGLRVGDAVTLKKGLIGGYFLIPARLGTSYRVRRIK